MSLPVINEIDFRTIPNNIPSLCIPRVFTNITEEMIRKIFEDLDLGIIERIDIITKYSQNGEKYNRVFIHFRKWFIQDGNANSARRRLLSGNEIKVIYDEPWFWKVSAYREPNSSKNYGTHQYPYLTQNQCQEPIPHPPTCERPDSR